MTSFPEFLRLIPGFQIVCSTALLRTLRLWLADRTKSCQMHSLEAGPRSGTVAQYRWSWFHLARTSAARDTSDQGLVQVSTCASRQHTLAWAWEDNCFPLSMFLFPLPRYQKHTSAAENRMNREQQSRSTHACRGHSSAMDTMDTMAGALIDPWAPSVPVSGTREGPNRYFLAQRNYKKRTHRQRNLAWSWEDRTWLEVVESWCPLPLNQARTLLWQDRDRLVAGSIQYASRPNRPAADLSDTLLS